MTQRIWGIVSILALFVAACGPAPPPPPKVVPPLGSRVELAAGEVWLDAEQGRERLITGAMLPQEAVLTLGEGARALVRMGNGTAVFLRGGTVIEIAEEAITLSQEDVACAPLA